LSHLSRGITAHKERNILHTIERRKANWIGHRLCRNCLRKHDIEGKTEGRKGVTGRRRRRRKQLLDDLKEKRGYSKLKEVAIDRTLWRTFCERSCGPVVRQAVELLLLLLLLLYFSALCVVFTITHLK
jgi:hypothetical protein